MITLLTTLMITLSPASCDAPTLDYKGSIECGLSQLSQDSELACKHLERAHELDLDAAIRDTENFSVDYCF